MNMDSARDNKCGREKAPFRVKRTPSIMQKDYIYHAKGLLLHSDCASFAMQKGFFAHLKLYFGSEKKPFGNMNGACDAAKTIKTDSQIL